METSKTQDLFIFHLELICFNIAICIVTFNKENIFHSENSEN